MNKIIITKKAEEEIKKFNRHESIEFLSKINRLINNSISSELHKIDKSYFLFRLDQTYRAILEIHENEIIVLDIIDKKQMFANTNFQNANMNNANMEFSNFSNSNFKNTILENANLMNAILENANFENANLKNAKLSNSLLIESNFLNADLTGVDFTNADITNVKNLLNAKSVKNAIFNKTKGLNEELIQYLLNNNAKLIKE